MARLKDIRKASGHRVAVVDDDVNLLESTVRIVRQDGHEVSSAETKAPSSPPRQSVPAPR